MDVKYLEKWIQSPIPGRRRKAIRLLTRYANNNKYDTGKILKHIKNALADENWAVRATAVSCMTDLALKNRDIGKDIIKILMKRLDEEDHSNVKGNILRCISYIVDKYEVDILDDLYRVGLATIDDLNNDVKHGSIMLLTSIGLRGEKYLDEIASRLKEIFGDLPPLLKRDVLRSVRKLYLKYPKKLSTITIDISLDSLKDDSYMARVEALNNLSYLIQNDDIKTTDEIISIIRKRLRDPKDAVKIAAIETINAILDKDADLVDNFMDIITNEILLRSRNIRLKINTLRCLLKHIDKISKDIVNRHNLPRVLDILEFNTVPKNEGLGLVKNLARTLLEEKLGYSYEERLRLRR